jgi:hypothetical protein
MNDTPEVNNGRRRRLEFCATPFTFIAVNGLSQLWESPLRHRCGVYLWCIEYDGAFLINYVGQTSGKSGFEGRLGAELKDWRDGRYWTPVEIEQFKSGKRVVLSNPPPDQRQRQLAEIQPLYRILLAPIDDRSCRMPAENLLVNKLCEQTGTRQFLANAGNLDRYRPHPILKIEIVSTVPLIGITVPVPSELSAA